MNTQRAKNACVTYLRVSTERQSQSGLGLEAQRHAVQAYAASQGHTVVAEFVEVESGKRDDRPMLAQALAACRTRGAMLVIAKLDRLGRSVSGISAIMNSGIPFCCVDNPHANRLTIHLLAAMAEHEREMISARTKAALAAAKKRGVKLGNPRGAAGLLAFCRVAAAKSASSRRAAAAERAATIGPVLDQLRAEGFETARTAAKELNRRGVPAPSGGVWYPQQVRRVYTTLSTA